MEPAIGDSGKKSAFTLIELSVVLVIIGLIVGGVLVGKDLINASEIRSQITQIEKFSTAANTFRSKYNGLAGDLATAIDFGLDYSPTTGIQTGCTTRAQVLGNGILNDNHVPPVANNIHYNGEFFNFWIHLTNAQLIEQTIRSVDPDSGSNCYETGRSNIAGQHFPRSPLGYGILAATDSAVLHFIIGMHPSFIANSNQHTQTANARYISPEQAYAMESKVDDGKPDSGIMRSIERYAAVSPDENTGYFIYETADGVNECMLGGEYNIQNTDKLCLLSVRAQ